jgi:CubicO group peptidase (beta-lactamase class C family)
MLDKMDVPGVAIATIEEGVINQLLSVGKILNNQPASVNSIFNTASIAKSITAYLAVSLIERGDLKLDERLDKYWVDPDLKGDKRVKLLTPHIILSHQTGFDNWRWMNEEKKLKFNVDPGTKVTYSGEGYEYLRKSLEKKFKRSFEELVEEYVFNPLVMRDSHLGWSDDIPVDRYAGEFKNPSDPYEITKDGPSAADDLNTTALDLIRFCGSVMIRANNEKYKKYFEPQVEARPGINFSYGLVRFDKLPNDEYALFGAGGDSGVSAMICMLPKSNRAIVLLSNGENRGLVTNLMRIAMGEAGNEIVGRFQ